MSDDFNSDWINDFASRNDLGALDSQTVDALLDLAGEAAHGSGDRRNAPLACFLAGIALGRGDESPSADAVKKLS